MSDCNQLYVNTVYDIDENIRSNLNNYNMFFSSEYANYIMSLGDVFLYVYNGFWIIPVRIRKKFFFSFGVFESEPIRRKEGGNNDYSQFLDDVVTTLKMKYCLQWIHNTAASFFSYTPNNNSKRIPFGSHVVDLTQDAESMWKQVHLKHKNVIRKSEKEAVIVKSGREELLEDFMTLERATWKRSGSSGSGEGYYAKQISTMPCFTKIYVDYKDNVPQAGALIYFNTEMAYYMYGVTKDSPMTGAANLLLWRAMEDMKSSGVKNFSFVGCRVGEDENSKYHGIQRFKERFGGVLIQGWLFRVEISPFFYKLFTVALNLRSGKLGRHKDAIDEEIGKWKDLQCLG